MKERQTLRIHMCQENWNLEGVHIAREKKTDEEEYYKTNLTFSGGNGDGVFLLCN